MDFKAYTKPEYYRNREISWLGFNERVLSEAKDKNIPLFERLKFKYYGIKPGRIFHGPGSIFERYGPCKIYQTGYCRHDPKGAAESSGA